MSSFSGCFLDSRRRNCFVVLTALESVSISMSVEPAIGGGRDSNGSGASTNCLPTFPPGKITEKKNLYHSTVRVIPSSKETCVDGQ